MLYECYKLQLLLLDEYTNHINFTLEILPSVIYFALSGPYVWNPD